MFTSTQEIEKKLDFNDRLISFPPIFLHVIINIITNIIIIVYIIIHIIIYIIIHIIIYIISCIIIQIIYIIHIIIRIIICIIIHIHIIIKWSFIMISPDEATPSPDVFTCSKSCKSLFIMDFHHFLWFSLSLSLQASLVPPLFPFSNKSSHLPPPPHHHPPPCSPPDFTHHPRQGWHSPMCLLFWVVPLASST